MTYLSLFCCQKQRRSLWTVFKRRGIRYFFLAVVDVEANYLMHRAFHYTTLTSVQVRNGMNEVMSLRIFQAEKKSFTCTQPLIIKTSKVAKTMLVGRLVLVTASGSRGKTDVNFCTVFMSLKLQSFPFVVLLP